MSIANQKASTQKQNFSRMVGTASSLSVALLGGGCASIQAPNTNTCMQAFSFSALVGGIGGTSYNKECHKGETVRSMVNSPNPFNNMLGYAMYLNQSPEEKKYLESRMSGKSPVPAAQTIAKYLIASSFALPQDKLVSQSLGLEVYTNVPEETQSAVNQILRDNNIDPAVHIPSLMAARLKAPAPTGVNMDQTLMSLQIQGARDAATAAATAHHPSCQGDHKTVSYTTANGTVLTYTCK